LDKPQKDAIKNIYKKSEKKALKALIFIKKGIIMVKSGEKWCELRWA